MVKTIDKAVEVQRRRMKAGKQGYAGVVVRFAKRHFGKGPGHVEMLRAIAAQA